MKLNKRLYKLLLFAVIIIFTIGMPLSKTYALQNSFRFINEFAKSTVITEPKEPSKPVKTGDDADPRPWLIILTISVFILRHILFFKKTKGKEG